MPITLAALAGLTALLLVVRMRWPRLSRSTQRVLLIAAVAAITLFGLMALLGLSTASLTLNSCMRWGAVAGYELLLLLFTRLRPRWLTGATAAVLLAPLLAASVLLPLASLFDRVPEVHVRIGQNILFSKRPWEAAGSGNGGTDLTLSRIPPALPFLRRSLGSLRLYNTQCDTEATTATADLPHHSIAIHCPGSNGTGSAHDVAIRVR